MQFRASLVTALAVMAAIFAAPAALAQRDILPNCVDPFFQAEINLCAEVDRDAADREMAAVYEQALAQYREQDRMIAEEEPRYAGAEMLLRESQKAWATSSSDFCAARTLSAQGGSMGTAVRFSCLAMLTRSRTEVLRWMLD
jgi:uncharacterized protein YecT (DUF1311 family)